MKLNGKRCSKNCYYDFCRVHKHNNILEKCTLCDNYTQSQTLKCGTCTKKNKTLLASERDELIIGYAMMKLMK